MGSYARGMLINCSRVWLKSHDTVGASMIQPRGVRVGQGSRATIFAESADWIPYIFSFIDFGRYYSVGVRFFGFRDFCS